MIRYDTYIINSRTFERIIRNTVRTALRGYWIYPTDRKVKEDRAVRNAKRAIACEEKKANL